MPDPNPDALSPARVALAAHIADMGATRARIAELQSIRERLREPERRAHTDRVCQESLQREHEELMGAWLAAALDGPGKEDELPDISQFALDIEEERLRFLDRVVEATQPALAKLSEQSTAAVQKLTALEDQLPAMVTRVHLEEAQTVAAELLAHVEHARSASARLQALRAIMVDNKQFKLLEAAPRADGIDLLPSHDQVRFERFQWDRYGAMLSVNPRITFEEAAI
jgi:hypothetical protein